MSNYQMAKETYAKIGVDTEKAINILKEIPVYKLSCNMEDEAAIVSYNGMKDGI